jgi:hypothetical protein
MHRKRKEEKVAIRATRDGCCIYFVVFSGVFDKKNRSGGRKRFRNRTPGGVSMAEGLVPDGISSISSLRNLPVGR